MEYINLIECMNTWQGEGPDSGKRMLLLRFKHCDRVETKIPCNFCDTIVKMRVSMESLISFEEIQKIIDTEKCGLMITGGEPTYYKHYNDTISLLNILNYPLANVETNGYNICGLLAEIDSTKNVNIIYSPKFFNQSELDKEIETSQVISSDRRVFIKLVVENNILISEYLDFLNSININDRVYLMPQGKTKDELVKNSHIVFDYAEKFKMNFSSRDHIIYEFI